MLPFHLAPQPPLPFAAAEGYSTAALALSVGPWDNVAEHRDIRFGSEPWQVLDMFTPDGAGPGSNLDVLVFFHGGGWTNGYKEWCGFMAPALAAHGVMLVAATHRLAPATRYPAFLNDALAAIAATAGLVQDYGGDPQRLFLGGHSAGGHVAAMCALRRDLWSGFGLSERMLKGACPISGILDLHQEAPVPGSLEARVYEAVLERPSDDHDASPLTWLRAGTLPLFLSWGERDSARVRRSNLQARDMLQALPGKALFREYPEDHFGTHLALKDPRHDWYAAFNMLRTNQI